MRVGVDARALAGARGVTRYARCLLQAMATRYPDDRWLLFVPGRTPLPGDDALSTLPNVTITRHPLPGRAVFGAAAMAGRPRLDRLLGEAPDLVWAPTVAPLALSAGIPLVLTVQDLSFEARPGDFTAYERLWHRLARPRRLARRAARIVVLAPSTRDELQARWGVDPGTVRVIAPGVAAPSALPARGAGAAGTGAGAGLGAFGLRAGGYLLAVGALEPRKAPEQLVRAFARARAGGELGETELVFAGEGRLADALDALGAPGVRRLGRVSEAELDLLYRGATALVMPSLLEGYGLPVREALVRGVPAVVSDLPVYGPELDPAILRVAPGDERALAAALAAIADPARRARLAAAAPGVVADLSWERAAEHTRALFAEAAEAAGG